MNNINPLVSIITPTKNSQKYLEIAIKSVINQTYENIEYIIIDGGSKDGTHSIIEKYDNYISSWESESDDSMYCAINKGLRKANGDIIAYLNSDDIYYPESIATVVRYFSEMKYADAIYGNLNFISDDDSLLFMQVYPDYSYGHFKNANYSMIGQPSSFFRASFMREIGLFDESFRMAADFDYFIRAGKVGTLIHVPEALAAFRVHNESLTSSQKQLNLNEVRQLHERYCDNPDSAVTRAARVGFDIYFKVLNWRSLLYRLFFSG